MQVACTEAMGQAGLHGAMARDVRPWLDLIESLRQEGVQEDMPLPQIAVMGRSPHSQGEKGFGWSSRVEREN